MADNPEAGPRYAGEGPRQTHRGDRKTGEKLIDKAENQDPCAADELTQEVEKDQEQAERFSPDNEA